MLAEIWTTLKNISVFFVIGYEQEQVYVLLRKQASIDFC